jgi:hypothetical protein
MGSKRAPKGTDPGGRRALPLPTNAKLGSLNMSGVIMFPPDERPGMPLQVMSSWMNYLGGIIPGAAAKGSKS